MEFLSIGVVAALITFGLFMFNQTSEGATIEKRRKGYAKRRKARRNTRRRLYR